MALPSAVPRSRAHAAAEYIEELARNVEPGEKLGVKSDLRDRVGVSVGTFNEALRLLQARRVVKVRPGPTGGVFAAETSGMIRLGNAVLSLDSSDPGMIEAAVRIRYALEPLILEDAISFSDRSRIAGMKERLAAMKTATESVDPGGFIHANWALHRTIAEAAPSQLLRELYIGLLDTIEAHTVSVLPAESAPVPEALAARYAVHVDLVDAIEQGDLAAALEALERHGE